MKYAMFEYQSRSDTNECVLSTVIMNHLHSIRYFYLLENAYWICGGFQDGGCTPVGGTQHYKSAAHWEDRKTSRLDTKVQKYVHVFVPS